MADGGMNLELNEDLTDRLIAAAEKAGRPAADYAAQIIGEALDDEWSEAERRWAEYERTGESVSLADAMAELRAGLKAHFDAKA
jgi:hypothetical protein